MADTGVDEAIEQIDEEVDEHDDGRDQHEAALNRGVVPPSDGVDEPIFFSQRYPAAQGGRIYILEIASGKLISHDLPTIFGTTPVIADVRKTGTLELIGLSWSVTSAPGEAASWRDRQSHLHRLDLSAPTPAFRSWAAYMGTETDGQYHPPRRDEE